MEQSCLRRLGDFSGLAFGPGLQALEESTLPGLAADGNDGGADDGGDRDEEDENANEEAE